MVVAISPAVAAWRMCWEPHWLSLVIHHHCPLTGGNLWKGHTLLNRALSPGVAANPFACHKGSACELLLLGGLCWSTTFKRERDTVPLQVGVLSLPTVIAGPVASIAFGAR